jgi:hypothetical protein
MDSVVMEESLNSEVAGNDFVDKQWLYVNDNNNQSYTGQVVVDTTSLSNSGAYLNWSEGFLLFPLILQMDWTTVGTATPTTGGAVNLGAGSDLDWVQGMKSGYWNILHNMSVEFNNSTIVQQSNFLNVFCSFKANTSWSDADVKNWGSVTGYCPDTSTSWVFNATANDVDNTLGASGVGLCNNRNGLFLPILSVSASASTSASAAFPIAITTTTTTNSTQKTLPDLASGSLYGCVNTGFYQRQKWLNFSLQANLGTNQNQKGSNQAYLLGSGPTALADPTANGNFSAVFMSCVQSNNATTRAMIFPAIVRLKDVCDFFAKCPLLKGSTMRFYMNTNQVQFMTQSVQSSQTAPAAVDGITTTLCGSMGLVGQPTILGGGQTCPVMVASCDIGQGCENLGGVTAGGNATTAILHTLSIAKTQFLSAVAVPAAAGGGTVTASSYSAPITSVRLYCPAYTFAPLAEARYLSLAPTKKIIYNDIFQYTIPASSVALGSTFSVLVTNGIPNLRSIVAMGFLPNATATTAGNGVTTAAGVYQSQSVGTLQSPFSSSGGSPDPIIIQNFQIQVSGKNLFINQLYYDFEQFTEQLVSSNQLNGSLTTSLGSGQISQTDFQRLYRYYYGNVSRHLPSEDGVSKSIQLLGQIVGGVAPTMLVFCEFEKEIVVDVRSGMRIV